ncbi:MAG TPA: hypothetical protein PKL45_12005, partial [Bacteroidia bacterium]|nr:hypothetical protein [Bacteroidia bacterium]
TTDTNTITATMPDGAAIQPPLTVDTTSSASVVNTQATPQPQTTVAAAGMNPAHGEPGHRCDIPVGSPLNSPPSSQPSAAPQAAPSISSAPQASPVMQPAPATMATPVAAPSGATATTLPGMNPPHGEPGHDCSIKVGDPLKKK